MIEFLNDWIQVIYPPLMVVLVFLFFVFGIRRNGGQSDT